MKAWDGGVKKKGTIKTKRFGPVTGPEASRLSAITNDCSPRAVPRESEVTRNPVGTWTKLAHLLSIYTRTKILEDT